MSRDNRILPAAIGAYVVEHLKPPDQVSAALTERTAQLGGVSQMQVSHEQATFLTMLVGLTGATNAIEIGTFTGYSSLAIARGLPDNGHLLCCDVSEEWTSIARDAWADAGVADRIDLVIAPAIETIRTLPHDPPIDFVFIDADKEGQIAYHDELVPRLRTGGVLAVDNVLWSGRVVDQEAQDEATQAIRAYNRHATEDDRVDNVILPIGDGLHLCVKR